MEINNSLYKATTIVGIKINGQTALAGDGQVTFGQSYVQKKTANKIRKLYNNTVIVGFAGGVADAFALLDKFEGMLQKFSGNLLRSCIELANLWRTDKTFRRLEAMMIAANKDNMYILSGMGDVIEPEYNIAAIGSGGAFALSAARALAANTTLTAAEVATKSLEIAADLCIYTNNNIVLEVLDAAAPKTPPTTEKPKEAKKPAPKTTKAKK